jgi:hypothetical protein
MIGAALILKTVEALGCGDLPKRGGERMTEAEYIDDLMNQCTAVIEKARILRNVAETFKSLGDAKVSSPLSEQDLEKSKSELNQARGHLTEACSTWLKSSRAEKPLPPHKKE